MAKASVDEWSLGNAKTVETPGVMEDTDENNEGPMEPEKAVLYRRTVARLNYASLDNPLISFATKEAARTMSAPRVCDEVKIKRILRYLIRNPVFTYVYNWQKEIKVLEGYTDSDWAGCRRTRRSTSGGAIFHGSHLVHHWSRTQSIIALSSAEAELNAMLKMAQEMIGLREFLREMELEREIVILGDSSAAKGILSRKGSGKVKHLEVRQLWLQEKVANYGVKLVKIPRSRNVGDALTHHWTRADNGRHIRQMRSGDDLEEDLVYVVDGECEWKKANLRIGEYHYMAEDIWCHNTFWAEQYGHVDGAKLWDQMDRNGVNIFYENHGWPFFGG